jgi:FdhD protein
MTDSPISTLTVLKIDSGTITEQEDFLACEEPLEIRVTYGMPDNRISKNISVTMRTPGNDFELAAGFLFTEGIINRAQEITKPALSSGNIIKVELSAESTPDLKKLERNFYTTSSCGVCGKSSIDAVRTTSQMILEKDFIKISANVLYKLPERLRQSQDVFDRTGGLHASALFDLSGKLIEMREDVGRHNALDKLIGACLLSRVLPLDNHILLLSGRASFELIQKAFMAGIRIVAAVGAPSDLAVELAKESDMTLLGFLRGERFNIYCGEKRISF